MRTISLLWKPRRAISFNSTICIPHTSQSWHMRGCGFEPIALLGSMAYHHGDLASLLFRDQYVPGG